MCLQTCQSVPLYWSNPCRYEPFRRCWPTQKRRLRRWVLSCSLIIPQHTNQGKGINVKKGYFADEQPALFHFLSVNAEQWKLFLFLVSPYLPYFFINNNNNNINGSDLYCSFYGTQSSNWTCYSFLSFIHAHLCQMAPHHWTFIYIHTRQWGWNVLPRTQQRLRFRCGFFYMLKSVYLWISVCISVYQFL